MPKPNYYILERANNDRSPLFESDDPRRREIGRPQIVTFDSPMILRLGAPVPKKPLLCDYHSMPHHIFSKRLSKTIESLEPGNIQMIPCLLELDGKDHEYSLLHASTWISGAMDISKSITGPILEKVVLDYDRIAALPERDQLIIAMAEEMGVCVFHETIKNALESTGGTGFRFFHVDDWSDESSFD